MGTSSPNGVGKFTLLKTVVEARTGPERPEFGTAPSGPFLFDAPNDRREPHLRAVGRHLHVECHREDVGPIRALLLDGDGAGVLVFDNGVPVRVYHTGTGRAGSNALADLAAPGPYDVELRELSADELPTDGFGRGTRPTPG